MGILIKTGHPLLGFSALAAVTVLGAGSAIAAGTTEQGASVAPNQSTYLRAADHRVASIAYRLALAGAPYCDSRYPLTGLLFHHLPEYGNADRRLMIERYRLDRGPGILSVIENSPAAAAGLIAGDVLLSVNSLPFPSPLAMTGEKERQGWRAMIEASEALLEEQLLLGPARLDILRDGRRLTIALPAKPGCAGRIRLARSSQPNAFADGRYVIVTTQLLNLVHNDDELAVVIAHELAHNILGHPALLRERNVPRGGLLRRLGKNASRIRATEEEADRLGTKLVWAAGYDIAVAIPFWRRFYDRFEGPRILPTHPSLADRERLIRETFDEIRNPAAR